MEQLVIHGGKRLCGALTVSGAKNASLPIMAATLLLDGRAVLHRVPRLADVETMAELLRRLGMAVEWLGPNTLAMERRGDLQTAAPGDLVRVMRGSICVLGPLLAARGAAVMPPPGGCVLGERPIDLHVKGLRALGADIVAEDGGVSAVAPRLRGNRVDLMGPRGTTVLGTANVLTAAARADGRTVIEHAACEPEVQDLCAFLNACGARITGIGTGTLIIEGVERLRAVEHRIIPDRIEAGTFLAAAVATGGEVTLDGLRPEHLTEVIRALETMGSEVETTADAVTILRDGPLLPAQLDTAPYPGLPTDMQPQLSALLCLADGTSAVREHIYSSRHTHVAELQRMGAHIAREGTRTIIHGVPALRGAAVHAADLRAGAALTLAGLAAEGITAVTGTDQLDRGYQRLDKRLRELGADVRRLSVSAARKSA